MSQSNDIPNPFDPLGFWRTTQNASLDAWSKAMIELVNTDAYAEATGRMLDSYLAASGPMRKAVEQAMTQVLGQFNMPTRAEVLSIAERMTNIEMRLDDLDARFDEMQRAITQVAAKATQTPETPGAAATKAPAKAATTTTATGASRPRRAATSATSGATRRTSGRATAAGAKE